MIGIITRYQCRSIMEILKLEHFNFAMSLKEEQWKKFEMNKWKPIQILEHATVGASSVRDVQGL